MKKILQRWRLISMAVVLVSTVLLGVIAWSSSHPTQTGNLKVGNRTQAIGVVSVREDEDGIWLVLQNDSQKNINAIVVAVTKRFKIEDDLTTGDKVMPPGHTYEFFIPHPPTDVAQKLNINVLSVVFDDNTIDGDVNSANIIRYRRIGWGTQMARILPLLQDALGSADENLLSVLKDVKARIASLPEEPEGTLAALGSRPFYAVKSGLHYAIEDVVQAIERLENRQQKHDHIDLREGLTRVIERQQRRIARF